MQKPANEKLWNMVIAQARAKFHTYPSPAASHWVHKTYVEHGGKFVETHEKDKLHKALSKQFEAKKRKHLEEKKKGKE
jgi:hypothetical protein